MAVNKDGLEAGKPVDFETLQRVLREQMLKSKGGRDAKPKQAAKEVQRAEQPASESVPKPTSKKAKKAS